ncbi:MAG: glycosyltransferase family 1 protein [Gemmatimonadaceae bacterium]
MTAAPRVVVDGRPLAGSRTGIGVHTAEILKRLRLDPPPVVGSHVEIRDRGGMEHCHFHMRRYPAGVLWQQLHLPFIPGDVVWGPHGTLPIALRKPAVVTVHDFSSITMAGRHEIKTLLSFNLFIARSLRMAKRVAAVSHATAAEAMRIFGIAASKIEIVPNGVDEFFSPGGGEGDYLLYAGTLEPRKGIDLLLQAWQGLPEPRPRLVLCGRAGWRTPVLPREGVELTGFVPREKLRELYRGALAFVYPSRHEGFGIPPLEAMACGAPVIATRTGAIPEYAAGAAVLIEPSDGGALAAALRRVTGDAGLRAELRALGPGRAALYRWDDSARRMADLLRAVWV